MVHDRCPNLISLQFGYEPFSGAAKLQWWLAGSLLLHLFAILAVHLNFSLPMKPVLASYQVALISDSSLPQTESPKVIPVSQPTQRSHSEKPVARERLSDSFSGALQSVVVPKQREVPKVSEPRSEVAHVTKTAEKARAATQEALQGITLPPQAPKRADVKPLVSPRPDPKPSPQPERLSEALKQTVQSIPVPQQRLSRVLREVQPSVAPEKSQARGQASSGITLPPEAPTLSAVKPLAQRRLTREAQPKRERLSDELKKAVQSISIPTQREPELSEQTQRLLVPKTAKVTKAEVEARKAAREALTGTTLPRETPRLGAVKLDRFEERNGKPNFERANKQIDDLIEDLSIPEVANIPQLSVGFEPQSQESQEARLGEGKRGSIAKGLPNPDLGRYSNQIRGAVQRIWRIENVGLDGISAGRKGQAPQQVVVKFQIQRSGKVTDVAIEQVSGSYEYDQAALRVVQRVSPLPPIPSSITAQYLDVHFTFTVERKDG